MKKLHTLLVFGCLAISLSASSSTWYVQIGAFEKEVPTDYFKGIDQIIFHHSILDIHRYYVGTFENEATAKSMAVRMKALGYNTRVINFDQVRASCKNSCGNGASDPAIIRDKIRPLLFDFDQYRLRAQSRSNLDALASLMKANPGYYTVLRGHTDARGTNQYNDLLSDQRVSKSLKYLVNQGVDAHRVRIEACGEKEPVAANNLPSGKDCTEGRQLNRRVEIIVKDATGKVLDRIVDNYDIPESISITKENKISVTD